MTSTKLKNLLHSANIGKKLFGTNNLIFDRELSTVSSGNLKAALSWGVEELSWWEYSARADCNKYHLMLCGRANEWLLRNTTKTLPDAIGMVWGMYEGQNHFWMYGKTENGIQLINYGTPALPVSYQGMGSFTA